MRLNKVFRYINIDEGIGENTVEKISFMMQHQQQKVQFTEIAGSYLSDTMRVSLSSYVRGPANQTEFIFNIRVIVPTGQDNYKFTKQGITFPASYAKKILEHVGIFSIHWTYLGAAEYFDRDPTLAVVENGFSVFTTDPTSICISRTRKNQRAGETLTLSLQEWVEFTTILTSWHELYNQYKYTK
jgi:hypothetical protein